jgi:hypothetical protein
MMKTQNHGLVLTAAALGRSELQGRRQRQHRPDFTRRNEKRNRSWLEEELLLSAVRAAAMFRNDY